MLREGIRMFCRSRRVLQEGFRRYEGSPEEMCRKIIADAFDTEKKYFRVSTGHFCEFYIRDFAYNCEALCSLGYGRKVKQTLAYALKRYGGAGKITTSIDPCGKPFDFPGYGPESLALLLYALVRTGNGGLARRHVKFLQEQVDRVAGHVIDHETLLPRADRKYQSLRDQVRSRASCYNAVMLAVIARDGRALGLDFPYDWQDIRDRIIRTYWNGNYFFSDISCQPIVIGDANVFPFWTGIITNQKMLKNAMMAVRAAGLDEPFPLRYVNTIDKRKEKKDIHFASWFSPDYMTDSIWMHLGLAYVRILSGADRKLARRHLETYTRQLEAYGTFLELFDKDGLPYSTMFYVTDEAMVWCAEYLHLAKRLRAIQPS